MENAFYNIKFAFFSKEIQKYFEMRILLFQKVVIDNLKSSK